jgi:hypothetical protein
MLTQFAKENNLATIIGAKTPGRLTSRSAFKIGHEYRLVLPIAAYQSWKGVRIEGKASSRMWRSAGRSKMRLRAGTVNSTMRSEWFKHYDIHFIICLITLKVAVASTGRADCKTLF